jgi:hypothetical protein
MKSLSRAVFPLDMMGKLPDLEISMALVLGFFPLPIIPKASE